MKILLVLVNCNSVKEAETIGQKALQKRLVACFDVFSRLMAYYFWPPKSGRIEKSRGCLLVLETLPPHFKELKKIILKTHSDQLPFIGAIDIKNVSLKYWRWLKGELIKN